jgi:FdhD protein
MRRGVVQLPVRQLRGEWTDSELAVVEEDSVAVYVNGVELAVLMATPLEQDKLALGFLCNEGVIASLDEVREVQVNSTGCCVDVWLNRSNYEPPARRILTSGCGGGVTLDEFTKMLPPVEENPPLTVSPERLADLMRQLQPPGSLHAQAGGTHTAGLSDGEKLLAVCDDIGRHNAVDKLRGTCLLNGIDCGGRVLLCTGRISSDMLRKAGRMRCPVVASRTTPTSMAVELAQAWKITLAGYVRGQSISVFTYPHRIAVRPLGSNV